ncbi:MAG: type II secretion system protein GspN [Myxococcales bacterium]|nr:type II secretion system protein GspN [Myxococcales bacterium]
MKARLLRLVRWLAFPSLYVVALLAFFYLCLPTKQLAARIEAEFAQRDGRARGPGEPGMTLEIGELDTYWFSGLELTKVVLTVPPRVPKGKGGLASLGVSASSAGAPAPSVVTIDRLTARVRILPLLLGRVTLDFRVEAFGGTVVGTAPYGSRGDFEAEGTGIQLGRIEPLAAMLQELPLSGVLHGKFSLAPEDGKFRKASGKLELGIEDVVLGDGKAKLMGVALPAAQLGHVAVVAKAEKGLLSIEELSAHGRDFEFSGEGKLQLQESWKRTTADVFLEFKFADGYRDTDDATRGLLGKPGQNYKPALELDPSGTFKKAKTDNDFYRFHVSGRLERLDVQPAGELTGKKKKTPPPAKGASGVLGPKAAPKGADADNAADSFNATDGAASPGTEARERGARGIERVDSPAAAPTPAVPSTPPAPTPTPTPPAPTPELRDAPAARDAASDGNSGPEGRGSPDGTPEG